jgi:hypothetical protein
MNSRKHQSEKRRSVTPAPAFYIAPALINKMFQKTSILIKKLKARNFTKQTRHSSPALPFDTTENPQVPGRLSFLAISGLEA